MANISWTANSISSFFNTSLGSSNSGFSGIYSSLSDASLIKRGVYRKLMDSYYTTLKDTDKTNSDNKTETADKEKEPTAISNKILDELLSDEKKTSTVSNKVLDELLSDEKKASAACTYNSFGAKTPTAASTIDQSI